MIPTAVDHPSHSNDSAAPKRSPTSLSPPSPSLHLHYSLPSSRPISSSFSIWSDFFTCSSTLLLLLAITTIFISPVESISCDLARNKCAFRTGCGHSLFSYMAECASLIGGKTDRCHVRCQNSLVALVSSEEGDDLVNCDCEGSKHCEAVKRRVETCKPAVYSAIAVDSIVSCTTARWICISDTMCRTALEYYNIFCRGLFQGSKCTNRCKNSLSILERQEKAAKLRTCYCDGSEDFPCKRVKYNTERYCYGRKPKKPVGVDENEPDNSIEVVADTGNTEYTHSKRHRHKTTNQQNDSGGAVTRNAANSWWLIALANVLVTLVANRYRSSFWVIAL